MPAPGRLPPNICNASSSSASTKLRKSDDRIDLASAFKCLLSHLRSWGPQGDWQCDFVEFGPALMQHFVLFNFLCDFIGG